MNELEKIKFPMLYSLNINLNWQSYRGKIERKKFVYNWKHTTKRYDNLIKWLSEIPEEFIPQVKPELKK